MSKLVSVVSEYAAEQVGAGADVIQIFDSWVGCLSVDDYRRYCPAAHDRAGEVIAQDRSSNHLLRNRQCHAACRRCNKLALK